MQCSNWFLLASLYAHLSLAAAPTPTTNLSALPNFPDNRFTMTVSHQLPSIDWTSCQMVIFKGLRDLTLRDFNGQLESNIHVYNDKNLPQAYLSVGPGLGPGSGKPSIRFAIWTVAVAMRDVLTRQECKKASYTGYWEGRPMVLLSFLAHEQVGEMQGAMEQRKRHRRDEVRPISFTPGAREDIGNSSFISFPRQRNDQRNLGVDELSASVTYLSKPLDRRDSFMHIATLMLGLAPINARPLSVFRSSEMAITAKVQSILNRAGRVVPYVLTAGDLISMLAVLPMTLLDDKVWREMDEDIGDNEHGGVKIAKGTFRVIGG
ncbi:MAG: hypothetical protein Q9170_002272 [Blastenia crenularia]